MTGELKNKIDGLWEIFWTGGITNPLEVVEQMTYLMFIRDIDSADRKIFKERLRDFKKHVQMANLAPFMRVLKTTEQWKEEIWNGIRTGYNNGFTEGCNNTIKVLKRVCYGFRNFENFRRRILYILNNEDRKARRTK